MIRKFFVCGRLADLKDQIMELVAYRKSEKAKGHGSQSMDKIFIIHEIQGIDYVLMALSEIEPYVNFTADDMLDSLNEIKEHMGIFPIITVDDTGKEDASTHSFVAGKPT